MEFFILEVFARSWNNDIKKNVQETLDGLFSVIKL